ncbi:uncharacterized protein BDR25DRAFT_355340 [Lindgomyces ingoldianus]|uniref:Uncharacterized protein n=1 Tax=Lindgomyces ingoldianus TaxID=673940 RepID=A0ACB6QV76_9PLEO|nr:uncharacterized protein BDR25DRAFT_355340 [Lindgomyces ingoldianus]KAF2470836.1 hypothetical protein BDR25DRAFT_355340 [Lindgomyces ingoldianus]
MVSFKLTALAAAAILFAACPVAAQAPTTASPPPGAPTCATGQVVCRTICCGSETPACKRLENNQFTCEKGLVTSAVVSVTTETQPASTVTTGMPTVHTSTPTSSDATTVTSTVVQNETAPEGLYKKRVNKVVRSKQMNSAVHGYDIAKTGGAANVKGSGFFAAALGVVETRALPDGLMITTDTLLIFFHGSRCMDGAGGLSASDDYGSDSDMDWCLMVMTGRKSGVVVFLDNLRFACVMVLSPSHVVSTLTPALCLARSNDYNRTLRMARGAVGSPTCVTAGLDNDATHDGGADEESKDDERNAHRPTYSCSFSHCTVGPKGRGKPQYDLYIGLCSGVLSHALIESLGMREGVRVAQKGIGGALSYLLYALIVTTEFANEASATNDTCLYIVSQFPHVSRL